MNEEPPFHNIQPRRGLLLSFEGVDGAGKSTQAALLQEFLQQAGIESVLLREPGGTELGESLRRVLLTRSEVKISSVSELLLFSAARAQLLEERVRPLLARGAVVLLDRFSDSTFAYQGYGRRLPEGFLEALETWVIGDCQPTRTWFLDASSAALRDRRAARGEVTDRLEAEAESFRERVREGYLERARRFPKRICIIDALRSMESIQDEIRRDLQTILYSETSEMVSLQ